MDVHMSQGLGMRGSEDAANSSDWHYLKRSADDFQNSDNDFVVRQNLIIARRLSSDILSSALRADLA